MIRKGQFSLARPVEQNGQASGHGSPDELGCRLLVEQLILALVVFVDKKHRFACALFTCQLLSCESAPALPWQM
ncbi:hypothetical protein T10_5664 [Trichinella papuae]|uniref:Uncharacterized protein n=1 Tax=Trichinella papuae TaxID=268474 RepID=A0A0V1N8F3_9BILA|nr:hypothetical protein T10_5664 [Trichinella papuae]